MAATAPYAVRYAPEDHSLPKHWKGLVDDRTGYLYYWNPETNVTQNEKPTSSQPPKFAPVSVSSSVQVQQPSSGTNGSYGPAKDDDKYSRGSESGHKIESGSRFSEGGRNGSSYSNGTANGVGDSAYGPTPDRGHAPSSAPRSELSAEAYCSRHEITEMEETAPTTRTLEDLPKIPQQQEIILRLAIKVILFVVFLSLVLVTVSADDGATMLQISKNFQPVPPRWSTESSIAYCKWKGVRCNHTTHRVISIDISGLSLGGVISPAINSLSELSEIYLQNNKLEGEIPELPKHAKIVYKPGNPLLSRHKSRDSGRVIGIVVGVLVGVLGGALLISICFIVYLYRHMKSSPAAYVENEEVDTALLISSGRDDIDLYSLESLRRATNDFSQENKLGEGSFGSVYKGVLLELVFDKMVSDHFPVSISSEDVRRNDRFLGTLESSP